jgi:hypothetical protein
METKVEMPGHPHGITRDFERNVQLDGSVRIVFGRSVCSTRGGRAVSSQGSVTADLCGSASCVLRRWGGRVINQEL